MANLFLTSENLKKAIQGAEISQEQKDVLISKVAQMSEEDKTNLLNVLKQVYVLNNEKDEVIKKIENGLEKI